MTNYRERDPPIPGVSLTTFKRNGQGVPAPMWTGRDGADLFAWTPADSWKVKRIRNNPWVLLAPNTRFERRCVTAFSHREGEIRRKYGVGYRLVTFAEQIAARGRKPWAVCGSHCHTEEFAEFDDLPIGSVSAGSGKSMRFNGTTVPRLENALSTEAMGLDDGVAVPQQAGIAGLAAFGLDESPAAHWARSTQAAPSPMNSGRATGLPLTSHIG